MKPLRESPESLNHGEQLLASLFESEATFAGDPFARRRIRARVMQSTARRRRGFGVALVVSALGLATAAAAMVGTGRWHTPWSDAPAATTHLAAQQAVPLAAPASAPTVALAASSSPDPIASAIAPAARVVPKAGEDPTLVASAIQALRSDHNPARARQLLNRYLRSNPRGALAEEALALSIEAAAAMQDRQASSLARSYLSAYPNGRHQKLAQRVLDQSLAK